MKPLIRFKSEGWVCLVKIGHLGIVDDNNANSGRVGYSGIPDARHKLICFEMRPQPTECMTVPSNLLDFN